MDGSGNYGGLSWFALRVIPQREDMVKKLLIWRGLRAFIKTERKFVHKSAKQKSLGKDREERKFCAAPSYVFVGLDAQQESPWDQVHNCHLIRSVVSRNNVPAKLNGEALALFLGFDDFDVPEYFKFFRTQDVPFKIGDSVRVDTTCFEGFTLPVKDIQRGEAIFDLVWCGTTSEIRIPLEQCYKTA
jgi:transcription antitermination factor NusG